MKQSKENEREGLLIAHYGATADVEDAEGNLFRCHLRKNLEPVITGDHVIWQLEKDNTGIVLGHKPRKSLLTRPENKKKLKLIAANIDVIVIVSAPPPLLSEYLIDRYLVAAENLKIPAVILLNKMDLLNETNRTDIVKRLSIYEQIGYRVIFSSIFGENGLLQLDEFFCNKTCVLVGTSGVGKSSIIAKFVRDQPIMVGDTSAQGMGKHTTTTTRLYHLPDGGNIIDSPGIREFSLGEIDKNMILAGFPEFAKFIDQCKFRNCQHQKEPGCALQQAVAEKKIPPSRWASYQEILTQGIKS